MNPWDPDSPLDGPDLTPMIDVVFLLIVFFMTVATIINAERIEVELPVAGESMVPEDSGRRETITVMKDGAVYAGIRKLDTPEDIGPIVKRGVNNVRGFKVNLRVDSETPHRHVREVMKICAENGAYNVIFSAYQTE